MSETEVNIPLLRKAVEWAEVEALKPDVECQWDQGNWVANPAQRAESIARDRIEQMDLPLTYPERYDARRALVAELTPQCGTAYCIAGYVADQLLGAEYEFGQQTESIAAEALRIDAQQATALFDGDNTIEDVRRIAESIAGERL